MSTTMRALRKPRAFLSYRHMESAGNEQANAAHRAWVARLAHDLKTGGVEPVWDHDIRGSLSRHCSIDALELPLCREISRIFPAICNAFVPVLTPAYLERLGIIDGVRINSPPYGVVFEEWQGGGFLVERGLLELVPLVRAGQAHLLNIGQLTPFFVLKRGLIDFRGNDQAGYETQVARLISQIRDVDVLRNPYSRIDINLWCDVYLEWSRVKFPERRSEPVDVWTFDTSAAIEFLNDFNAMVRTTEAITDPNCGLMQWHKDLHVKSAANRPLQYKDLTELVFFAMTNQEDDEGWEHLAKTAEFCDQALKTMPLKGDFLERSRAQNNVGALLFRLASRRNDRVLLQDAIIHLRDGLESISGEEHVEDSVKLQSNLADALRAWGILEKDDTALKESCSLFEKIALASAGIGDSKQRDAALAAILEIRTLLPS